MKFVVNTTEINRLRKGITEAIVKGGEQYKRILQKEYEEKSYDLGELRDSVKSELINKNTVRISTDKIQGMVDEFGRKPGGKMPPISALKGRAGRKLGDEKLAFAVAKSIQRKGIKAKRTFSKTRENNKDKILDKISKDIGIII